MKAKLDSNTENGRILIDILETENIDISIDNNSYKLIMGTITDQQLNKLIKFLAKKFNVTDSLVNFALMRSGFTIDKNDLIIDENKIKD